MDIIYGVLSFAVKKRPHVDILAKTTLFLLKYFSTCELNKINKINEYTYRPKVRIPIPLFWNDIIRQYETRFI